MTSFDKDEIIIIDALNELNAHLVTPELMSGIRRKLDSGTAPAKNKRKPVRLVVAAAIVVALTLTTALAAGFNIFDWLQTKANPPFASIIEPVEPLSTTYDGIKLTVAAAAAYNDEAIIYVTLEDVENRGRIRQDTLGSFGTQPPSVTYMKHMGCSQEYFDEETGIAAFKLDVHLAECFHEENCFPSGTLVPIYMDCFHYGTKDLYLNPVIMEDFDLASAVANGTHITTPEPTHPDELPVLHPKELTPGYIADIPESNSSWISAIGVNEDTLVIQCTQPSCCVDPFMSPDALVPYLLDPDGNIVSGGGGGCSSSADSQFNIISQYVPNSIVAPADGYYVTDWFFKLDTKNFEGYKLGFKGFVHTLVTGEWYLEVDLGDVPQETLEITTDVDIGGVHLKDALIQISPLTMKFSGNGSYDPFKFIGSVGNRPTDPPTVSIETTKGVIKVLSGSYGGDSEENTFECSWFTASAVDLNSVTAINMGGTRIEIKR